MHIGHVLLPAECRESADEAEAILGSRCPAPRIDRFPDVTSTAELEPDKSVKLKARRAAAGYSRIYRYAMKNGQRTTDSGGRTTPTP